MDEDYRVATYPVVRGRRFPQGAPEGKNHAYLRGTKTTACGFGLVEMHAFDTLLFVEQPHADRCSICERRVRAASR